VDDCKPERKKRKVVKSGGEGVALVVGEDFQVSWIVDLEGKAIVGKFCGQCLTMSLISVWMESAWGLIIGYVPTFHLLSWGWICIVFHSKEDVDKIISGIWYWDQYLFCVKPWHPLFNAHEESRVYRPLVMFWEILLE